MWDLFPWPGIKPGPLALEVPSLGRLAHMQVPSLHLVSHRWVCCLCGCLFIILSWDLASGDTPPPSFCWSPLTSLGSFLEQDPRQYFSRVLACMYHTRTRENMLIWPTVGKSVISQTVASSLPHRMAKPDLYFLHIPDVTEIWPTVSQIGRNIHMAAHNHNPNPNPAKFLYQGIHTPLDEVGDGGNDPVQSRISFSKTLESSIFFSTSPTALVSWRWVVN